MHDSPSTHNAIERPPLVALRSAADLRLRARGGPFSVRVHWPAITAPGSPPPAIVVLANPGGAGAIDPADDFLARQLCAVLGAVALATPAGADPERDAETLEWAADHAAELGADATRLALAGRGAAARAAVAVADRAVACGWPPIAHLILLGDESAPGRPDLDAARWALR